MRELSKIEDLYFKLIEEQISIREFEVTLYQSDWLEDELGEDKFVDLLSLNFRNRDIKHEIQNTLREHVDYQNWGMREFSKLMDLASASSQTIIWEREYDGIYNFRNYLTCELTSELKLFMVCPYDKLQVGIYDKVKIEKENEEIKEKINRSFPTINDLKVFFESMLLTKQLVFYSSHDVKLKDESFEDDKLTVSIQLNRLRMKISKDGLLERLK